MRKVIKYPTVFNRGVAHYQYVIGGVRFDAFHDDTEDEIIFRAKGWEKKEKYSKGVKKHEGTFSDYIQSIYPPFIEEDRREFENGQHV